jgi:glycosyltransferase involved in cell wall biosynthesis
MNVLFIGTTDILGGAAKISWELKTALEKEGHKVSMFVADKRSKDKNVHVIPRQSWRKYVGLLFASENFLSTDWILNTKEFKEADIVHCHNLHGRYFNLSTLQKMSQLKPVVWTLHDEWAITPHCACTLQGSKLQHGLYVCPSIETQPRILWDNSKKLAQTKISIYKQSNLHIVTPSKWLYNRVSKTILKEQNLKLIPNGINSSIFTQTDKVTARQKLNLPLNKKIVLFLADAGKSNPWKGWKYAEEMVHAFENDENVLFLNVGNFNSEAPEKNVEYRMHIKNTSELALYYSAADTLLFTSVGENFPLVILEAMSCGLPIVSFDVGGVKEVVTHQENGFIASYKDTVSLKAGLDWVLTLTDEEKSAIAKCSSEKITTHYNTSTMIQSYFDLYRKLTTKI